MTEINYYDKIRDILFIKLFVNYLNKNINITKLIEIVLNLNLIGDFLPNKKILSILIIILLMKEDVVCLKYLLSIIIIKRLIEKNNLYFETLRKSKYYKSQNLKLNIINFYKKTDDLNNYINSFKLKLSKKEIFSLKTKLYKLESDFLCESDTIKTNYCDTDTLKENLKLEIIDRLKLLVSNISLKLIYLNTKNILVEDDLKVMEFNEVFDYYENIIKSIQNKINQVKKESKLLNNLKAINNIFIDSEKDIIKNIKDITKLAVKYNINFL